MTGKDETNKKPNCYECEHRRTIPGDAHSACNNKDATVTGSQYGIQNGWFLYPINYDPVWLKTCNGFSKK